MEEIHHGLYTEAFNTLNEGKDLPQRDIYVCSVCGNTVYGSPPDNCQVCNVTKDKFFKVE